MRGQILLNKLSVDEMQPQPVPTIRIEYPWELFFGDKPGIVACYILSLGIIGLVWRLR
jgi:hypothetical protein